MLKSLAIPVALIGGVIGFVLGFIAIVLVGLGLAFHEPYAPALVHAVMAFKVFGQNLILIMLFLTAGGCAVYVFEHWPRQNDAYYLRLATQWIKDRKRSYAGYSYVAGFPVFPLAFKALDQGIGHAYLGLQAVAFVVTFAASPVIFYPFGVLVRAIFYGLEDIWAALTESAPAPRPALRQTPQGEGKPGLGGVYRGVRESRIPDLPGEGIAVPMYSGPVGNNCAYWREHPESIVEARQLANSLNLAATLGMVGYQ